MQASKSKLHAHRFICGRSRRFRVQMARARCFSLIARSAVCSAKTARSAAERPRDRTLRQMHWRKPFSLWRKKVRITSTLLPAPIMCRKLSKRCKLPENRGFRFLLYTIPADMSRWKRCSCSMVTLTSICRITSITAATMQVCTRMRRIIVSSPFRLLMKWCARQVHRSLIKMVC